MMYQVSFRERGDKFRECITTEASCAEDAFDFAEEMYPEPVYEMISAIPIFSGRGCLNGNCEDY